AAKLAKARDMAQALAKQEKSLAEGIESDIKADRPDDANSSRSQTQSGLAEEAKTLAELVKRLRADAAEESRELSQAIARAEAANEPGEIEDAMRQVAAALGAGRRKQAGAGAEESAKKLDDLARDLEAARRSFVQPQLDALLAL